jgi:flavin-dependent dehydrogenase
MFVTDADLFPGPARVPLQPWWTLQVRCTSHVRRHVAQYNHVADPIVRCARSQRLDRFTGIGWCAVGDAAMAFDPLSSRGIAKAVAEGRLAADAIAAHLSGDRTALHDYGTVLEEEYRDYRLTRASYYALERRWPSSEFWRRRYAAAAAGA